MLRPIRVALLAIVAVLAALVISPGSLPRAAAQDEYLVTISLAPLEGEGLVGGMHTVTATVDEIRGTGELTIEFEIIDGPNQGLTSKQCVPSCVVFGSPDHIATLNWTYTSNGIPGTDSIIACAVEEEGDRGVCSNVVTMTWVRPRVGAFPAPVAAAAGESADRNRARAAATAPAPPSVTAPSTGTGIVTPPNTGDGGLLRR